jgi:tetraprenyl-beta-curcumene synthase
VAWGLRSVSSELHAWQARAASIPDAPIREDALYALAHKRTHAHGAGLFSILPRRRNRHLLRLLVAYELIWDFLDNVNERAGLAGTGNGRQLHLAITEAVDPSSAISDYYRHNPSRDDGGYLSTLVTVCRQCCASLPSYPLVRELVVREARRAEVLAFNHDPDPERREAALERWVAEEYPGNRAWNWWELSGAASAPLGIHALLALAAEPECSEVYVAQVYATYCPFLGATTTMLDSYVDQLEDARNGDHSYVAYYGDSDQAACAISALIHTSLAGARALRCGSKHAIVAAAMVAMYLSKDSARTPELHEGTARLLRAGGSLTRLLHPILRAWRMVYAQRSA